MDELTIAERAKYEKVWADPSYRKISPGMMEAARAFDALKMRPGARLIDFGAGTCRASTWFMEHGLRVRAIDFVNASEHPEVPFIQACLWAMPESVGFTDYGFCCDVMEHIPPEKVDYVLWDINRLCRAGVYFRIATRKDVMGPKLIGEPLHLSIHDGEWWRERVEQYFVKVDVIRDDGRDIVLVGWQ